MICRSWKRSLRRLNSHGFVSYNWRCFSSHQIFSQRFEKVVPFSNVDIFQVVSDVGKYQEFIPFCVSSQVKSTSPSLDEFKAELEIGFGYFSEKYCSSVSVEFPSKVEATSIDSHLFKNLYSCWLFTPLGPKLTRVSFDIQFQVASTMYANLVESFFTDVAARQLAAFEKRCEYLHRISKSSEFLCISHVQLLSKKEEVVLLNLFDRYKTAHGILQFSGFYLICQSLSNTESEYKRDEDLVLVDACSKSRIFALQAFNHFFLKDSDNSNFRDRYLRAMGLIFQGSFTTCVLDHLNNFSRGNFPISYDVRKDRLERFVRLRISAIRILIPDVVASMQFGQRSTSKSINLLESTGVSSHILDHIEDNILLQLKNAMESSSQTATQDIDLQILQQRLLSHKTLFDSCSLSYTSLLVQWCMFKNLPKIH